MKFEQVTPQAQIDAYIKQQIQQQEKAIIYNLHFIGVQCINEAREAGAYRDVTGNLRSSIGYLIVKDGRLIEDGGFDQVKDGAEGTSEGKEFIQGLVQKYPHGLVLIVVAGMKYAAAVEARNVNVLTSAELLAQSLIPGILKQLGLTS